MKYCGFTLIELMIVVVIIGILAMAAVPLYSSYITEAAHAEATTTLADIASKEEAYHATWKEYLTETSGYVKDDPSTKTPQVGEDGDNWFRLGYNSSASEKEGGLFGGPMYFKYMANATSSSSYIICAHRLTTSHTSHEYATLSSDNRRTVLFSEECPKNCKEPQ